MDTRQEYTIEEIEENDGENGKKLWVIIGGKVYDVTNYKHPGGREMFEDGFGEDRKDEFDSIGHSPAAIEEMKRLQIGFVKSKPKPVKKEVNTNKKDDTPEELHEEEINEEDEKSGSGIATFMILSVISVLLILIFAYTFYLKN
jgi:cytochrome b involved in lipid metabolism